MPILMKSYEVLIDFQDKKPQAYKLQIGHRKTLDQRHFATLLPTKFLNVNPKLARRRTSNRVVFPSYLDVGPTSFCHSSADHIS